MEFNVAGEASDKRIEFTKDQEVAIKNLIDFIATPWSDVDFIRGLCGAGGTGKTFITDYIINHCRYSLSVIKCTAPTHKACRVLSAAIHGKKVETIQSTFGLRLDLRLEDFDPEHPQFNPMASPKIANIRLLIIDEASMLPIKLLNYIIKTCKENKVKIIMQGDASQLPPVNEKKSAAFTKCTKVYYLKQIVRQEATNPIKILLDILREDIDNRTYRFLEYISRMRGAANYNELNEGFIVCGKAKFKELIDKSFNDELYAKNIDMYRIVAYTNNCVTSWNNYIRHSIIADSDKSIITKNDLIMSYETIVNEFMETVINNSEEYVVKDIVDYVDATYGFNGFLVKFQMVHGGSITRPLFIINHRDKFSIQKYYQVITSLITDAKNACGGDRGAKWRSYYDFKKKYILATNIVGRDGRILFSRDIDYGFAITSHKSQGSTYDTVFVDVNDMVYDRYGAPYSNQDDLLRRLYVACSRARKELILCYGE